MQAFLSLLPLRISLKKHKPGTLQSFNCAVNDATRNLELLLDALTCLLIMEAMETGLLISVNTQPQLCVILGLFFILCSLQKASVRALKFSFILNPRNYSRAASYQLLEYFMYL